MNGHHHVQDPFCQNQFLHVSNTLNSSARTSSFTTALSGSSGVFTQEPQYNEQLSKDQFLHHCSNWIFTQGPHTALHSLIYFSFWRHWTPKQLISDGNHKSVTKTKTRVHFSLHKNDPTAKVRKAHAMMQLCAGTSLSLRAYWKTCLQCSSILLLA